MIRVPKAIGLEELTLDRACRAGERIAQKVSGKDTEGPRSCPIRREFIRADIAGGIPPMVRMLRGGHNGSRGRGGELRLKVYLSMLWHASGEGHTVDFPAYGWAHLLGLDDTSGKRRVQDAIVWLNEERFVAVQHRPGQSSIVQMQREDGSGSEYRKPYTRPNPEGEPQQPSYRKLDPSWWTNGWMAALSGAALITWLTFLDDEGANLNTPRWISTSQTKTKYALSPDTRKKGIGELLDWNLLARSIRPQREAFLTARPITSYRLNRHILNTHRPNEQQRPNRRNREIPAPTELSNDDLAKRAER